MRPSDEQKAGAQRFFERMLAQFGLQPARVYYEWKTQAKDDSLVEVSTAYPYRKIALDVFPPFWKEDQDAQEEALLHEVMHVLLEPLEQHRLSHEKLYSDAEEDVCDRLSMAWHRLMKTTSSRTEDRAV